MATTEIFYQKVTKTLLYIYLSFFGFAFFLRLFILPKAIESTLIFLMLSPFLCGGILFLLWQYCKHRGMPNKFVSLLFISSMFFCLSYFFSFIICISWDMYPETYACLFATLITIAILHCILIFSSLQYKIASRKCLLELLKIGSLSYFIFYSTLYILHNNDELKSSNHILFIFIGEVIVVWASYLITCGKDVCIAYCKLGKDRNVPNAIVLYILGVCKEIAIFKSMAERGLEALDEERLLRLLADKISDIIKDRRDKKGEFNNGRKRQEKKY